VIRVAKGKIIVAAQRESPDSGYLPVQPSRAFLDLLADASRRRYACPFSAALAQW